MTLRAVVIGSGHYLPSRVVENAEFEATLDTDDAWIARDLALSVVILRLRGKPPP